MKKIFVISLLAVISIACSSCMFFPDSDSFDGKVYLAGEDVHFYGAYWSDYSEKLLEENSAPGVICVDAGIVYVAGMDSKYRPCYWKNGVKTVLSDKPGGVISLYVRDNRVYSAGCISIDPYTSEACYWINKEKTVIPDASSLYAMFVSNGIIYTAGYDNNGFVCYWTGTKKTILSTAGNWFDKVQDLLVYDGSVYVVGAKKNGTVYGFDSFCPVCWINGTVRVLSGQGWAGQIEEDGGTIYIFGTSNCVDCYWEGFQQKDIIKPQLFTPSSMSVNAGTVIFGGCLFNSVTERAEPCYWNGASLVFFPEIHGVYKSFVEDIVFYQGNVYCVGNSLSRRACYWEGQEMTVLSIGGKANSVFVSEGTIYTAGSNSEDKPCYWKGNDETILSSGGVVNSIFVYNDVVYTAGYDENYCACYWIGAEKTVLSGVWGTAMSIFVYDGIVYVGGKDENRLACLWTGNTKKILFFVEGIVNSVFVDKGVVFCGGSRDGGPFYCVGMEYYMYPDWPGSVNSIFVYNGTVYAAGENQYGACYWAETTATNYQMGCYAYSIYVCKEKVLVSGIASYGCYWVGDKCVDMPPGAVPKAIFATP